MNQDLIDALDRFQHILNQEDVSEDYVWGAFQSIFIDTGILDGITIEWWTLNCHYIGVIDARDIHIGHTVDISYFQLSRSFKEVGKDVYQKIDYPRIEFDSTEYDLNILHNKITLLNDIDNRVVIHTDEWKLDYAKVH